ncbi:MAG: hypothetical protein PHQ05_02745 [Sterolibacterium sp.]|nr:hypothetical protein [Sterolibacterium sp.]
MSKQRLSFINVLNPPVNQWLKEITKRNTKLPSWVRVVRFNDDDDEEPQNQSSSPLSEPAHVSTEQAA